MAVIGRFSAESGNFRGEIDTLTVHANPVWFKRQEKGADFVIIGPAATELGAGWRKAGAYGDYVSVKLDCPCLAEAINAILSLKPDDNGEYLLKWQRRKEQRTERGDAP